MDELSLGPIFSWTDCRLDELSRTSCRWTNRLRTNRRAAMKKETILENCANEPVRVKRSTLKIENCAKPPVYNSPIHNAQKSHIAKKTSSNHRTCATRRNATRSCTCDYRPNDTARSNTCVNKDRVAVKPQRYGCVSGGVECNELRVAFECCKAAVRPRAGARHYTAVPKIHSLDSLCGDDVMII